MTKVTIVTDVPFWISALVVALGYLIRRTLDGRRVRADRAVHGVADTDDPAAVCRTAGQGPVLNLPCHLPSHVPPARPPWQEWHGPARYG